MDTKILAVHTDIADCIIADMGKLHHTAEKVGSGPMPASPFQMGLHWVTPISHAPKGHERWFNFVKDGGYPIQGFILIDDPIITQEEKKEDKKNDFQISVPSIPNDIVVTGVSVLAAVTTAIVIGFGYALVWGLLHDPYLAVVCDDPEQSWVLIDQWYD